MNKLKSNLKLYSELIRFTESLIKEKTYLNSLKSKSPPEFYNTFAETGELEKDIKNQEYRCVMIERRIIHIKKEIL